MTLIAHFERPQARLERAGGRWQLVLADRPSEAQAQVRYLGRRADARKLRVTRNLRGSFSHLKLPTVGVAEVSVRYADPSDIQRDSPWLTLKLPTIALARDRRGHAKDR